MRANIGRLAGSLLNSSAPRNDLRRSSQTPRNVPTNHKNDKKTALMSSTLIRNAEAIRKGLEPGINDRLHDADYDANSDIKLPTLPMSIEKEEIIISKHQAEEHAKSNKIEVMDKNLIKKIRREHQESAQLKSVRSEGCGPNQHVSDLLLLPFILQRSKGNISANTIALCNFHDLYLAGKLCEKGCSDVLVFEKDFENARSIKKLVQNSSWAKGNVTAYTGDPGLLFARNKKRLSTYEKLLHREKRSSSLQLYEEEPPDLREKTPLFMSVYPTYSQQNTVLKTFRDSLLQNLANPKELCMFQHGPVEFLTFLHPAVYISLTCSIDPLLVFYVYSAKKASYTYNKLFHVQRIDLDESGAQIGTVDTSNFSPAYGKLVKLPYELKARGLGYSEDRPMGVSIRPRQVIRINNIPVLNNGEMPRNNERCLTVEDLFKFVYFMDSVIGVKRAAKMKAAEWFSMHFGEKGKSVANGLQLNKIIDAPDEGLEAAFMEFRDEIVIPALWLRDNTTLL